jgi:4-hydroxy-4-methyl-2-oxoglutarate aldolase
MKIEPGITSATPLTKVPAASLSPAVSASADVATFALIKEKLFVAVVCDVLDALGYRHQTLHSRLRPLLPDANNCGFVGRARTLRWMETDFIVEQDPYGLEIEAVDSLRAGDVIVHSTDRSGKIAPWGELMTTVAMRNGAVGCVCDAPIRDCTRIMALNFPVYYAGICPLDSKGRGRVMAYDVPVQCGEIVVQPRQIIFADYDGIVAIPREVEEPAIRLALEKVEGENKTRLELQAGKTLREVYNQYGIL